MEEKIKYKERLELLFSQSPLELTKSDKYLIRLIWNKYIKLYKQQNNGELKAGEYAIRRKNYINLINDILGFSYEPIKLNK